MHYKDYINAKLYSLVLGVNLTIVIVAHIITYSGILKLTFQNVYLLSFRIANYLIPNYNLVLKLLITCMDAFLLLYFIQSDI